jgi:hypothetical protein
MAMEEEVEKRQAGEGESINMWAADLGGEISAKDYN